MPDLSLLGIPGGLLKLGADPYLKSLIFKKVWDLEPIRVLQVQCSDGSWLLSQQQAFGPHGGIEFFGLDEDERHVQNFQSKASGVPIFCESFANFKFPPAYFHFIYWDATRETEGGTLEFLKRAMRNLHPTGSVLIRYYLAEKCGQWPLYDHLPDLREADQSRGVNLRDVWKLTQAAGFKKSVTASVNLDLEERNLTDLAAEILSHRDCSESLRTLVNSFFEGKKPFEESREQLGSSISGSKICVGEVFCLGNTYFGD